MTTTTRKSKTSTPRFIVLDTNVALLSLLGKSHSTLCADENDILDVLPNATRESLWISTSLNSTDTLLRAMRNAFVHGYGEPQRQIGNLLLLECPRPKAIPFLQHWFRRLIGESSSFKTLPQEQLLEVLIAPEEERQDLFIGGVIDREIGMLSLIRGNLERIAVPLSIFRASGTSRPNFSKFELGDYGHSVRFGDYEAAADFILFESAPDYRRRLNERRHSGDAGFGPSLRRLRIQRGLSRSDFPGVSAKAIARLERGEVEKPQKKTLSAISKTLQVNSDEIESY